MAPSVSLYIFNQDQELLHVLDNDGQTENFRNAVHKEQINGDNLFEFQVPAHLEFANDIVEAGFVGFRDVDDVFQMFEIMTVEEEHADILLKTMMCEHISYELNDEQTIFHQASDTATNFLDAILNQDTASGDNVPVSDWDVGTVEPTGTKRLRLRLISRMNAISRVASEFLGELRFRIGFNGNQITTKTVDLFNERGADTGKRFVYSKDITSITRTVETQEIKTALFGFGKAEEIAGEGTQSLRFDDVEWSTAAGDPTDKPLGQIFVGDGDALTQWGRDGRHRFGIFTDKEETDDEALLQSTWDRLQSIKEPRVNYKINVVDLETIAGIDHEKIRLGDTVKVIDTEFKPELRAEVRVKEINRNLEEPEQTTVELSNLLRLITDNADIISSLDATINENQGVWEERSFAGNLIRDHSIENVRRTGSDLGNTVFAVDTDTSTNPDFGNEFWWNFDGLNPRIISALEGGTVKAFFADQALVITDESEPFIHHELAQSIPNNGLNGDYTASAFVAAFDNTIANGTAVMEYSALDATDTVLATSTRSVTIRSDEKFNWKRIDVTLEGNQPTGTTKFKVQFKVDTGDNPDLEYMVDGVQAIPLPNPIKYEPQSSLFDTFHNKPGMIRFDPVFYGNIFQKVNSQFSANTSADQSISATTFTTIVFDNAPLDTLGEFDTTTGTFTAQDGGVYLFSAAAQLLNLSDGTRTILRFVKNGTPDVRVFDYNVGAATSPTIHGSQIVFVNAGDAITVEVWSGEATDVNSNAEATYFKGFRLGGE